MYNNLSNHPTRKHAEVEERMLGERESSLSLGLSTSATRAPMHLEHEKIDGSTTRVTREKSKRWTRYLLRVNSIK